MNTPNTSTEQPKGKSLDEIADILAANARARLEKAQAALSAQPNEVTNDDAPEDEVEATNVDTGDGGTDGDEPSQPETESEGGDGASASSDDDQGRHDEAEAADEADPALAEAEEQTDDKSGLEFEIDEDTVFQLDDETEVSYADLKAVYQADKQTLELVNTQKQATQEALAERTRATEDSLKVRRAAEAVFEHFDKLISTPMFKMPDESLKVSNPELYIQHLEAFNQDQQRIAAQRADLVNVFNQHTEAEQEMINNRKAQEIVRLTERVPALKNAETKAQASKDILNAAERFGFQPEEVNNAIDSRIYEMAYYAEQYFKIMEKSKMTGEKQETPKTRVRNQARTLRSRGTTAQTRQTAKANTVKAAKVKARKTGKVDDVADFIAARAVT